VNIREAMRQDDVANESPRIAAKFWDEFIGKQTSLDTFFGKGPKHLTIASPGGSPPSLAEIGPTALSISDNSQQTTPMPSALTDLSDATPKRRMLPSTFGGAKAKKKKVEQSKLSTFFSKPSATKAQSTSSSQTVLGQLEEDYNLAAHLSSEEFGLTTKAPQGGDNGKAAWGQLFARTQPPKCHIHNEPTKELTVTKAGPNKGKNFFICSRCVFRPSIQRASLI
jgi:AP endonuclease-2